MSLQSLRVLALSSLIAIVATGCGPTTKTHPLGKGELQFPERFKLEPVAGVLKELEAVGFFRDQPGQATLLTKDARVVLAFRQSDAPEIFSKTLECRKLGIARTGCAPCQVLGNSRPPQPPHASVGQWGI